MKSDYTAGDVVVLQQLDTGITRLALVDDVTKGGRVVCTWRRQERKAGLDAVLAMAMDGPPELLDRRVCLFKGLFDHVAVVSASWDFLSAKNVAAVLRLKPPEAP